MGLSVVRHVYVDESIHARGGFIVTAVIFADHCVDSAVKAVLKRHGFRPDQDEFKNSMVMANNLAAQGLRGGMRQLLFSDCKLAFVICALQERKAIMSLVGRLIDGMPALRLDQATTLHFDEGIAAQPLALPERWVLARDCDSKRVAGIQLADCAAHLVATILLAELGLVDKMVSTDGLYPEPEVPLAWELRSSLRHSMASDRPLYAPRPDDWTEPIMEPFGLLISEGCPDDLRQTIEQRLGGIWLGCIH